MAIIENVEFWWVKCDPKNPVKNPDASKPDHWEIQLRTTDKDLAMHWAKNNVKFKPLRRTVKDANGEVVTDDLGEPKKEIVKNEAGLPYFAVNLRKKTVKANGEEATPVSVIGGMEPLDPKKVGNGSFGNVRVFQYEYTYQGKDGIATMLMALQVTKLKEYVASGDQEGFKPMEMEIIKDETAGKVNEEPPHDDLNDEIPF